MATDKALSERNVPEGPEGPEAPEAPENERPIAVREPIGLIVKAQKALRLDDRKNTISEKLETDLFNRNTHQTVPALLADLSHPDHKGRAIRYCVDPEK